MARFFVCVLASIVAVVCTVAEASTTEATEVSCVLALRCHNTIPIDILWLNLQRFVTCGTIAQCTKKTA